MNEKMIFVLFFVLFLFLWLVGWFWLVGRLVGGCFLFCFQDGNGIKHRYSSVVFVVVVVVVVFAKPSMQTIKCKISKPQYHLLAGKSSATHCSWSTSRGYAPLPGVRSQNLFCKTVGKTHAHTKQQHIRSISSSAAQRILSGPRQVWLFSQMCSDSQVPSPTPPPPPPPTTNKLILKMTNFIGGDTVGFYSDGI